MSFLELPVRSDVKSYEFTIELDGFVFTLRFKFNDRSGQWGMSIADAQNNDILSGIVLLTNIDLVNDVVKEELPLGRFFLIDESGEDKNPGPDDLGNDVKLIYVEAGTELT